MLTHGPYRALARLLFVLMFVQVHQAISVAQRPFTCEDQFFLTLNTTPPTLSEVVIDPQTNAVVFKSISDNLGIEVNAAGYRSVDNLIYCVNPNTGALVRIDADGVAEVLKILPLNLNDAYFAGDVTPDGRYLLILGTRYFLNGSANAANLVRIDLEDPDYGITVIPINRPGLIFDIAFHPVTDELYGYDSATQRLVRINPETGALFFNFPPSGVPVNTGSLFFDAYGRLFAYGSTSNDSEQNRLYSINPATGASTFLYQGPPARASDGCSCPYTVLLSKTVSPRQTFPCTEVEYTFEIVNTSRRPHEGILLEDQLPPGFTFVAVRENPLGGNVLSQPGDTFFRLSDVDLPDGRFKITIVVRVGAVAAGIYRNQAMLRNLPVGLGSERRSDDPFTTLEGDSTSLTVLALSFDSLFIEEAICEGVDFIRLDAQSYFAGFGNAVKYHWDNGSTNSFYNAERVGQYRLVATAGCDTAYIFYNVKYSAISVEILLNEDAATLSLGDSVFIRTSVFNTDNLTTYFWTDPLPGSLRCPTCADSWARPFNNVEYTVQVQNEFGCRDSASIRLLVNKNKNIYFPNVFMPAAENPDNGYFYGSGDGYAIVSRLSVYSRWGEQLYEARDITLNDARAGWDGTFRGQLMLPGVYTWVAEIAFLDGDSAIYAGDVTLIR